MRKNKIKTFLILFALAWQSLNSQLKEADYRRISQIIIQQMERARLRSIGIMPFTGDNEKTQKRAEILRDDLIFALVEESNLQVVEREEIEKLLKEKELEQSGLFEEKAGEIGSYLKVDALLFGKIYQRFSGNFIAQLRLVNVQNATIIGVVREMLDKELFMGNLEGEPVIQIALLLDTSNSMDGLINQAKAYLWKIVNEITRMKLDGKKIPVEVALYEYGKSTLPKGENYLRMVVPFRRNLDEVSEALSALTTQGGEEYAGAVIWHAVENLNWSKHEKSFRSIFIAGNESFAQGEISWEMAIKKALEKGIIINTIYCGPREEGIALFWEKGAFYGRGSFAHIDQNQALVEIPTPYDEEIRRYGEEMNSTYIPYGPQGEEAFIRKNQQDAYAKAMSYAGSDVERQIFKAREQVAIQDWDLVSRFATGKQRLSQINKQNLPLEYRDLSLTELEKNILEKWEKRKKLQKNLQDLENKRREFLEEKKKSLNQEFDLATALIKALRQQMRRKNFSWD